MINRSTLKAQAKAILKHCYWVAFFVTLIVSALSARTGLQANFALDFDPRLYIGDSLQGDTLSFFEHILAGILATRFVFIAAASSAVALAISVFAGNPLMVGQSHFFLNAQHEAHAANDLLYAFREERYWKTVKAMLLRDTLVLLWGLLLVIPGIIKSYAYCMVPFILAENPKIGTREALRLSAELTAGYKWSIFVLDLSFIGWNILGGVLCCVGGFFVRPYYQCTRMRLYKTLKGE